MCFGTCRCWLLMLVSRGLRVVMMFMVMNLGVVMVLLLVFDLLLM